MLRRALLACLLLVPLPVLAHSGFTMSFTSPVGPDAVVTAGDPFSVTWHDGDLSEFQLQLFARSTPAPGYIHQWPVSAIAGTKLGNPIDVRDAQNSLAIDTAALGPGSWFFWFSTTDPLNVTEYEPPGGVLTIVAPGAVAPPAVWFDAPAATVTASSDSYPVTYTTRPRDGVTVDILGSRNDLEGEHLEPLAVGLPGGAAMPFVVSLRCVDSGAYGVKAVVHDAKGATGTAFATGRISWRRNDPLPADCPPDPDASGGAGGTTRNPAPARGCCSGGSGDAVALAAGVVFLALRRR